MADQQKVMCGLSNRVIFNDLERRQTQILKLSHYLRINISEYRLPPAPRFSIFST